MSPSHRQQAVLMLVLVLTGGVNLNAQPEKARQIQEHYRRAQEALNANQPDLAAREFREILRLEPSSAEAHANLGLIAFARGDYVEASGEFRTALKYKPTLRKAKAFLGMCEARLGHRREATALLEKSFRELQDSKLKLQAGTDLLNLYYEDKQLDQALDVLRVLEKASPNDADVLYNLYRIHSDLAARALARMVESAPESARLHQVLAQMLLSQDDFPRAIEQYRRAAALEPRLPEVHFELGRAILANSREEEARAQAQKEFEAELAGNPNHAESEYYLGEIDWLRSDSDTALKHYSRALELQPSLVYAHIASGKVLTSIGQPEKALVHLQEAIRLDPLNEIAHYRLALAFRKLGRKEDEARERAQFEKLRESQAPIRSLYEQIRQKPPTETVEEENPASHP